MPIRREARRARGPTQRELAAFLFGTSTGALALLLAQRLFPPTIDPDVAHFLDVRRFVLKEFVQEVEPAELVENALKGMVGSLDDYSRYYDESQAPQVDRETSGRFTGIGVVFRGPIADGQVLFPLAGSPADEAGLQVGDRILAIDAKPLAGMSAEEVLAGLQGEPESVVTLRVKGRDGSERTHAVRRRSLLDPTVRHARLLDANRGIGYVALVSFSHQTKDEFDRSFEALEAQGMRGLVLDLRGNPGGVLGAAVEIARRFVDSGVIVSTRGRADTARIEADPAKARWAGFPLVVLVDADSASASEVLAGALQDHRAAVLVGAPTHGKGMVQTICRYRREGTIAKITTSHYYTPALRNLERDPAEGRDYGLVPDLEVPITDAQHRAVLAFAQSYGPPVEKLAELAAWEREDSLTLLDPPPSDPQLDAAVELLSGHKPLAAAAGGAR